MSLTTAVAGASSSSLDVMPLLTTSYGGALALTEEGSSNLNVLNQGNEPPTFVISNSKENTWKFEGFRRWCIIISKIVLLDFFPHLNYKIIKLQHFKSWILLLSSGKNGEEDRKPKFWASWLSYPQMWTWSVASSTRRPNR
jgi:hypothetical protein